MFLGERLKELFNIEVSEAKEHQGDVDYSNLIYELTGTGGRKYILKIFDDPQELALAEEEARICGEIAPLLSFRVPETISGANNELFFDTPKGKARLSPFIGGDFIMDTKQTPEIMLSLGEKIGELDRQLEKIESPLIESRRLPWDIKNAHFSFDKSSLIKEPELKRLVDYFFDRFHHFAWPRLHSLRHSIIHGDLNDHNILVKDGEVEGFIDFGDSVCSALVCELAVACAYMMMNKNEPVKEVLPLIEGYNRVLPLKREEMEILPELITARLCISLCNSAEKKEKGLDNDYVLISEKPARDLLEKWISLNPLYVRDSFLGAAGVASGGKAPDGGGCNEREACKKIAGEERKDIKETGLKGESEPERERLLEIRRTRTGSSLSLHYDTPVYMKEAAFQYMYNAEGKTFLDTCNNIPHIGHCHPAVSKAVSVQSRLLNTNTRYLYDSFAEYTCKLLEFFPSSLNKVFLVNSGSAATDLAIRMACIWSRRRHLAVLSHGYHGNTLAAVNVSSYKFDGRGGEGTPENVIKLPLPKLFNGMYASGKEYAANAKSVLQESVADGNRPAAFIAEPVSGCGGQVPVAPGYFKEIEAFLKKNGILFIMDEVQTGFGRLGDHFWGFSMHGVTPDMVILGKPMGNGHPVAAVVTTSEIADAFDTGMEFFSSFGGNTVSCKVAGAVIDVICSEKLQENASLTGGYLKEELGGLKKRYPQIGDVRGEGLFLGVELVGQDLKPATELASRVKNGLRERCVLAATDGPFDNVIKIKPPLCFNRQNAAHFIDELERQLKDR